MLAGTARAPCRAAVDSRPARRGCSTSAAAPARGRSRCPRRIQQLTATVFELPVVAEIARERIAAAGLADRIEVVRRRRDGRSRCPPGTTSFLVANLVHYWSPEQNRTLLQRIRAAPRPDARLLLADFWTDPTHTGRSPPL